MNTRNVGLLLALLLAAGCSKKQNEAVLDDTEAMSWELIAPGTVYKTRTVTRILNGQGGESVTETRQTLLLKNDAQASIRLEASADGIPQEAQVLSVPMINRSAGPECPEVVAVTTREWCDSAAGTFDCEKTTLEVQQGDSHRVSSTWTTRGVPVPVKWSLENEQLSSTTELLAIAPP